MRVIIMNELHDGGQLNKIHCFQFEDHSSSGFLHELRETAISLHPHSDIFRVVLN